MLIKILHYSPVADPSVLINCIVKSYDEELLRISLGSAGPVLSLTLYTD